MSKQVLHAASETKDDINVLQSEGKGQLVDATNNEVMQMVLGRDDDIDIFGRMGVGGAGDVSEFDARAKNESEQEGDPEEMEVFLGDSAPAPFVPPVEHFPLFKHALRHFQARASKPRVLRVDTPETFQGLVADATVNELERRLNELQRAFDEHVADPLSHPHSHEGGQMRALKSEILGAAEAISDLKSAKTADEAVDALPQVPLDLPPFAEGKVKCWKDGDQVVCSVYFCAADGSPRVATMAARPRVDEAVLAEWSDRTGVHPVTLLGAVEHLADAACGRKLVREVAGAALQAQRRADVVVMGEEPTLLVSHGDEGAAPLAALMHIQQMADAGDSQAAGEVAKIESAASTPAGKQIAGPVLAEARKRLSAGKKKPSLIKRLMAWVQK